METLHREGRRPPLIMRQRTIPGTRTPGNSSKWLVAAEIDGRTYSASSRRGAPQELARVLVAAGIPDQPVRVLSDVCVWADGAIRTEQLRGHMNYHSLHGMAGWTSVEGERTILGRTRYREDERFASPAARPVISLDSVEPEPRKNALQPAPRPRSHPVTETRLCAHCSTPFAPSRAWSLHCSPKCRVAALRARRRAVA
jgi:hypothetical protein